MGICVGMQLLANKGFENGIFDGLGWIKGKVEKIKVDSNNIKVPHMGWNEVIFEPENASRLKRNLSSGDQFYFVHNKSFD